MSLYEHPVSIGKLEIVPSSDVELGYKRTDVECIIVNPEDYERLKAQPVEEMLKTLAQMPEEFEDEN